LICDKEEDVGSVQTISAYF